ncbi:hypothetical protein TCAL_14349 [Tigriopus californicus]|uniref:BTB domain-containing protein n=1 Tax=Tigriopus californicus TaxID=6832 RepID=A0A553NEJ6_TIGCA|nr:hypothetical protein TCAL_14349 [Tigriopus californicus]
MEFRLSNHDVHSNNLVAMLASFQSTYTYTDLRISSFDGITYEVHQAVLASVSPFLSQLFKEQGCCKCHDQSCEKKNLSVILDKVHGSILGKFLSFIYKGEMLLQGKVEFVKFYSLLKLIGVVLPNKVKDQMKEYYKFLANPDSVVDGSNPDGDHPIEILSRTPKVAKQVGRGHSSGRTPGRTSHVVEISVDDATVIEANILEVDTLSCRFCHVLCERETSLNTHYAKEHFYNHLCDEFGHLRNCSPCGISYLHPSEVVCHFGVEHNRVEDLLYYCRETDKDLTCTNCEQGFFTPKSLIMHMASTHQKAAIETLFHFQANCPVCGTGIDSPKQFLNHLVLEHDVLYQVVPILIRRRLQRLTELESLRIRSDSRQNDEGQDHPVEGLTNSNLTCPICYQVFDKEEDLKLDVANHYEAVLNRVLAKEPGVCPSCNVTGSKSNIFNHWILDHPNTLSKYLPEDIQSLFVPSQMNRGTETALVNKPSSAGGSDPSVSDSPDPPMSEQHKFKTYKCGICLRILLKKSIPNHYCNVHLKGELRKYCRIEDNACLLCDMTFRQQRRTFCHVGQAHGFMDSLLKKYPVIEESCEISTPSYHHQDSNRFEEVNEDESQQPASTATNEELAEPEEYPCLLCENTTFSHRYEWKEHLFEVHYNDEIMETYGHHETACPMCKFQADDAKAICLHIAVTHDKIFNVMPAAHLERIQKMGFPNMPPKKLSLFYCPICVHEKSFVGAHIFRRHLFYHCSDRFKANFDACGKKCPYCSFVAREKTINLRHIAITHGNLAKYLPQEVVQNVKEQGLCLLPTTRKHRRPKTSSKVWKGKSKIRNRSKVQSNLTKHSKKNPMVRSKGFVHPIVCPVCNRNFIKSSRGHQEARRHLLHHYKPEFLGLYSRFGNNCPICSYSSPIFYDNMRHIAGTHVRVLNVLPCEIIKECLRSGLFSKSAVLECRSGIENDQLPKDFQRTLNSIDLDSIAMMKNCWTMRKKPTEEGEKRHQVTTIGVSADQLASENLDVNLTPSSHANYSEMAPSTEEDIFHGFNGMVDSGTTHLEDENDGVEKTIEESGSILKAFSSDHLSIPCCICKRIFAKKKILTHLATHFKDELIQIFFKNHDNISSCPICRESYLSQEAFIFHMSGKHGKVLECLSSTDRSEMERLGFVPEKPRIRNRGRQSNKDQNGSLSVYSDSEIESNTSPLKGSEITRPNDAPIITSFKKETSENPEVITNRNAEHNQIDESYHETNKASVYNHLNHQVASNSETTPLSLQSDLVNACNSIENKIQENGPRPTFKLRGKTRIRVQAKKRPRVKDLSESVKDGSFEDQGPPSKKPKIEGFVETHDPSVDSVITQMGERFVCGLCSNTFGGTINDIRRHVLCHFTNALGDEVSNFKQNCAVCKKSYSNCKFIFHIFLSHRMYEDSTTLPQNVIRALDKSYFNVRPKLAKICLKTWKSLVETGEASPNAGRASSQTKSVKLPWKMKLFQMHKQDLQSMFPNARTKCPLCQIQLTSHESCLRHLAFQHYRILDFIRTLDVHQDILANTNPIVPPHGEHSFWCSNCSFSSGDAKELQEHMTCHYYGTVKERVIKSLEETGTLPKNQNEIFTIILQEIQNPKRTTIEKSSTWNDRFQEIRSIKRSREAKSITSGPFVNLQQVSPETRLKETEVMWSEQATFTGIFFR